MPSIRARNNPFPSILLVEGDPEALEADAAAGQRRLAVDSTDHLLYLVDDAGVATQVGGASGSVATDTIWNAAGDLAYGTGSDTATRLGIGTALQYLRTNAGATAPEWATLSATTNVGATHQRIQRTAGSLTLTGNTTTHTELSSALRLTLAAATGDVIQAGITGSVTAGANGEAAIDIATIVSSAIVNRFGAGGSRVGLTLIATNVTNNVDPTATYVVVSGDISGGNVVLSPSFYQGGAGAGSFLATTTYALTFWAVNLKQ